MEVLVLLSNPGDLIFLLEGILQTIFFSEENPVCLNPCKVQQSPWILEIIPYIWCGFDYRFTCAIPYPQCFLHTLSEQLQPKWR